MLTLINIQPLPYKGYTTIIKYSKQDKVFYGKIDNIDDLVSFHSEDIISVTSEFHKAVNDYIETLKELTDEEFWGESGIMEQTLNAREGRGI